MTRLRTTERQMAEGVDAVDAHARTHTHTHNKTRVCVCVCVFYFVSRKWARKLLTLQVTAYPVHAVLC